MTDNYCIKCDKLLQDVYAAGNKIQRDFYLEYRVLNHLLFTCVICNYEVNLCNSIPDKTYSKPIHLECAMKKWSNPSKL